MMVMLGKLKARSSEVWRRLVDVLNSVAKDDVADYFSCDGYL
jgi:hypothetical protein